MKTNFRVKEIHNEYESQINNFCKKKKNDRAYFEWFPYYKVKQIKTYHVGWTMKTNMRPTQK